VVASDPFNLSGKTALVTGSSAGIGAAIAVAIAEAGADVICHGNSRPAEETCKKIERLGRRATAIHADLSRTEGAHELFQQARTIAAIDILVNNAGIIKRAPAHQFALEDWDLVLQVNLRSVFQLSQLAGREWIENKKLGKIVNIASLLAFQGGITVPAYAASKGAVAQLPCNAMRPAIGKYWNAFPPANGENRQTSAALQFFFAPPPVIMSTAMSW
jgi:2-deoxy-D-gluconate 3-dehydrogenase